MKMCGGFQCSKNALIALNVLYIMVGILLICVGVYSQAASIVTNLPIVSGILACGVILIMISILGLAGAVKHHQVMLFFYMIILFMLFLIQFSIACSCLAVNSDQQKQLAEEGWNRVPDSIKKDVQETFNCCGFNQTVTGADPAMEISCEILNRKCCFGLGSTCSCPPCLMKLEDKINYAFQLCGGIGLFFSFTEVLAVFITWRYRNLHDPYDLPARAIFPHNYHY
ncbi:tetraspanin-13 [Condylostylus longicornis]|uniref:tetraspanin-13 n=1 Tax=Condylostylus longicornis TaxID=2530218 RepID=UPI00244E1799|nr:tetraspanin-13 [Condylostylus longicornis]